MKQTLKESLDVQLNKLLNEEHAAVDPNTKNQANELLNSVETGLDMAITALKEFENLVEGKIHTADIEGYFTAYLEGFKDSSSGGIDMSIETLRDRLNEMIEDDEDEDEEEAYPRGRRR